ncbi:dihydropteroate synthase [Roseobacter cerasinus]|uniref:Dihydropteroate synthase n=1 Tax=Roseobacter cerasinus TaxID=2602289 RepID=A0A640VMS5_9RHOB|nr:dihydropteroate synthase [Roseobacter cerasinus]GFE48730.1 dihydropteroate synthase [Roseobacter cerasinus]
MTDYIRPLVQVDIARPDHALPLAGGWGWFTHVEILSRAAAPRVVPAEAVEADRLPPLTRARAPIAGLSMESPQIMGILNVTPDSFSDGGRYGSAEAARDAALAMQGADIIDIGGESTRPGAETVSDAEEIARTAPVIRALKEAGLTQPMSIDTRKSAVAAEALTAGAVLVNDVSGFTYDADLAPLCAKAKAPVCVMHSQGDPATMQRDPRYADVVLDVYDALQQRIEVLVGLGIPKTRIIADPGIGFGKTLEHNLALLARLSVFHGLGVPILLGASRKRFVGTISGVEEAHARMPGSVAVALAALKHGTQIVRVHDVPETAQAIALWRASVAGRANG